MLNKINTFLDTSVGPNFLHISSTDLQRVFSDSLQQSGVNTETALYAGRTGNSTLVYAKLPDLAFYHEDSLYMPTLYARNRNDGTLALSIGLGLFRMVCMNGLYMGVQAGLGGKVIHRATQRTQDFVNQIPQLVAAGIEQVQSGALQDVITDASAIPVFDAIDIVGNLPGITFRQKDAIIAQIINGNFRKGDRVSDSWGLYNVVNETVRHKSRSALASANRDIGLLEEISFLASNQKRRHKHDTATPIQA